MKYNPLLDMQGQSLASLLSDDWTESVSSSWRAPAPRYPCVRKFRPGRETLPTSAPLRQAASLPLRGLAKSAINR